MLSFDEPKLLAISCFLLLFSAISYWRALHKNSSTLFKVAKGGVIASNFLFAFILIYRWFNMGYFPLSNLYESLIFLNWGLSSIQLFLEFKTKSRIISSVITPILFFISSFSSLALPIEMQRAFPLLPSLQSNWLMMHVSTMIVSYAALLIGSLLSILYLAVNTVNLIAAPETVVITSSLNTFGFSKSLKISLLETLDIWSYRIIGLGFPLLTAGIISGAVWANEAWGAYWSWDPKETWALITWLMFAIYLHSRILKGWQGQNAAIVGSCGFFTVWICYLGVNFLGKGLHSYGWVLN